MLLQEKEAGWLEWFATDAEAEQKYGEIVYSRIGVVEKGRQEQQKRRLIHDLRRSGVKQQVTMRERVRRPRGHSTLVTFDGHSAEEAPRCKQASGMSAQLTYNRGWLIGPTRGQTGVGDVAGHTG